VNVVLQNRGDKPSVPALLRAVDARGVLFGDRPAPSVVAGGKTTVSIPLQFVGGSSSRLGGVHPIVVHLDQHRTGPLNVTLPTTLCSSGAPASPSSTATPAAVTSSTAAPSSRPQTISARSTTVAAIRAATTLAAPANVRAVASGTDCGAHVGPIGALVCPDMMKSGDLLLIWDWQPGSGPVVDGYRIYVGARGVANQLVGSHANKEQTLFDVPKPRDGSGYSGKCYAVSAYAGNRESARSPVYCAGGGSVAKTIRLNAIHSRLSYQTHRNPGSDLLPGSVFGVDDDPASRGFGVGFSYTSAKRLVRDSFYNVILRSAWAFDVSPLINHQLFSAKLQLRIATSDGAGNNHSCATNVGEGVEFWWQGQNWIEGRFGDDLAPTDVGPVISADVTKIVAPWLRGEPNYGFVLKNADENLNAFANKSCVTTYTNPVLELTYY
jgi:hypothetical protein